MIFGNLKKAVESLIALVAKTNSKLDWLSEGLTGTISLLDTVLGSRTDQAILDFRVALNHTKRLAQVGTVSIKVLVILLLLYIVHVLRKLTSSALNENRFDRLLRVFTRFMQVVFVTVSCLLTVDLMGDLPLLSISDNTLLSCSSSLRVRVPFMVIVCLVSVIVALQDST